MNKNDRKELEKALKMLEDAQEIIDYVKDCEQEKFDNLTEGLQASENGAKLEENAQTLDDSLDYLRDCINTIEELI